MSRLVLYADDRRQKHDDFSIAIVDMNHEKREFLSLSTLPARLGITEASWFLGFSEHDISTLVSAGLLKPLGHPSASGSKYFATSDLQTLKSDARWLAKASDAVVNYWKSKNSSRKNKSAHQPATAG